MSDEQIDDLKDFMASTISQQVTGAKDEIISEVVTIIDAKITASEQRVIARVDNITASIAEAMDAGHEAVDEQLQNHEQRLTRLEQQPV